MSILENSAPVSGASVPNGTDIHDVAWAVMEMIDRRRPGLIPKYMREEFLNASGDTCSKIAERILHRRYPPMPR